MTKTVDIEISKTMVLKLVEALSVNIGRKNPGVDFETLWASEGDEKLLDIYYKEAVTDLENMLKKWILDTSDKIDVNEYVDDEYVLHLGLSDKWPERLKDLLDSKVQEYLAHATLAGWVSCLANLEIGSYKEIATTDIDTIISIITRLEAESQGRSRHGDRINTDTCLQENIGDRVHDDVNIDNGINDEAGGERTADDVPQEIRHECLDLSGVYNGHGHHVHRHHLHIRRNGTDINN